MKIAYQKRENLYLQESKHFIENIENLHQEIQNYEIRQIQFYKQQQSNSLQNSNTWTQNGGTPSEKFIKEFDNFLIKNQQEEMNEARVIQKQLIDINDLKFFTKRLTNTVENLDKKLGSIFDLIHNYVNESDTEKINQQTMKEINSKSIEEILKNLSSFLKEDRKLNRFELELSKYKKKIVEQDNEIEIAKCAIIHYKEMNSTLDNMLKSLMQEKETGETNKNNNDTLEKEKVLLIEEINRIKEQNILLQKNRKIIEELHEKQIQSIGEHIQKQEKGEKDIERNLQYLLNLITEVKKQNDTLKRHIKEKEQNKKSEGKIINEAILSFAPGLDILQNMISQIDYHDLNNGNNNKNQRYSIYDLVSYEEVKMLKEKITLLDEHIKTLEKVRNLIYLNSSMYF